MLGPTTNWALVECLVLEVVAGEAVVQEVAVGDSHPVVLLNSICHQILVHPCTLGQVSILCSLRGPWGALEEGVRLTLDLACPHNSNMDRAVILLTALRYQVVGAQGVPCLLWEEIWVQG